MNQKSRQNTKNAIKKDFCKLMNNANFGFDYRNNANNAKFKPIIDEISDISYIKKYCDLFDNKVSNFVNSDVLEQQTEHDFQLQIANVKCDDPFRSAKMNSIKNQNSEGLDALIALKERRINQKREILLKMLKPNWMMRLKTKDKSRD